MKIKHKLHFELFSYASSFYLCDPNRHLWTDILLSYAGSSYSVCVMKHQKDHHELYNTVGAWSLCWEKLTFNRQVKNCGRNRHKKLREPTVQLAQSSAVHYCESQGLLLYWHLASPSLKIRIRHSFQITFFFFFNIDLLFALVWTKK